LSSQALGKEAMSRFGRANSLILGVVFFFLGLLGASHLEARGGGGCVSEGSRVLTPGGASYIENLKQGDPIWTWGSGGPYEASVQALLSHYSEEIVLLRTRKGSLLLTGEQLLMTRKGEFRRAAGLSPGKSLLFLQGNRLASSRIREIRSLPWNAPVYNLLVWPGGIFAAEFVLTHNKGCFLPEMLVLKANGEEVPISMVKPGDEVLGFEPEGEVLPTRVLEVLRKEAKEYLELTTERTKLRVTRDHPFYVGKGKFRSAEFLRPGDLLWSWDGNSSSSQKLIQVQLTQAPVEVFHLRTDRPHTFFVCRVGVHNKGGSSGGGSRSFRSSSSRHTYPRTSSSKEGSPWLPAAAFLIMILVFTIILSSSRKSKSENLDHLYSPGQIAKKARKTLKLLQFLAGQDPGLSPEKLSEKARTTFLKLQECWEARDYGPMEPLMTKALHARHLAQLNSMRKNKEINRIEDLKVEAVDLVHIHYSENPAERFFTALITASAKDYYVDERTGAFLRGDRTPARFQEFWSFSFQEGGWLLSEIEQAGESDVLKDENFVEAFTQETLQRIYGEEAQQGEAGPWLSKQETLKETRTERLLNFLVQTDPLWNKEKMLQRAKEVFTSLYMARESGDPEKLPVEDLFPDLAENLRAQMQEWKRQDLSMEMRNFCVRKVGLVLVENFKDPAKDSFTVRIDAHAQRILRKAAKVISQEPYVTPFQEYWSFGRLQGAWKLKEVLPPAKAQRLVSQENLDEESTPGQLQWYYRQERAV
jgi:predicted lipid-binding transport protein (Tim44 family)